ncbi:MAG: response regulator [Planctomycetes bacterium]|nr:response regulator [Planctomycetota bacterium]
MDTTKIEKLLQNCELRELYSIEAIITTLIEKAKQNAARQEESKGKQLRTEDRFETNLMGTLIRVTDVKPGERKEFSITIQDLSRSGMRFKVDTNFIPSRIVEALFGSPGGKIKKTFMEVVRMRKHTNQDGSWLEVGCRSVSDEAVRRIRLQEERITRMRNKLHKKSSILVLVVGLESEEITKLINRINSEGYQAKRAESPRLAIETAKKLKAHLIIYYNGKLLCRDKEQLKIATSGPSSLATLAVVNDEEQQFDLFRAGIDECFNVNHGEDLLFFAMERALIGHTIRQNETLTGQVLVVSNDNTKINLVFFQFEDRGYICQVERDVAKALEIDGSEYDLILTDFDEASIDDFKALRDRYTKVPLIALCDDMSYGTQAMAAGANNYLCMPPTKENMHMILESCVTKAVVA